MTQYCEVYHNNPTISPSEIAWITQWCKAFPTLIHSFLKHPNMGRNDPKCHYSITAYQSLMKLHHYRDNRISDCGNTSSSILSSDNNDESTIPNMNLGYGEIRPESIIKCINIIQNLNLEQYHHEFRGKKIVDLGSGNGLVLLASIFGHNFDHVLGVEIIKSLHDEALENQIIWEKEDLMYHDDTVSTSDDKYLEVSKKVVFTFLNHDFTCLEPATLTDADVIVCHGTLFDTQLMREVLKICEQCDSGTYFIMVSQALQNNNPNQETFITVWKGELAMDWGNTTVYIQRKTY